ncbi:hypothetical protein MiAbW_02475 [Microcystis aeruginosa NIES-4325]|uniref:DUF5648 domain-containing protein n=1 Tax=Microcystis aeruginosa NIES-4325 TaxID=2569534 RepID=A0A5J4FBQ4_MICAE|nr:hypothetical protein [Microcystis aeruginosa]GEA27905.1 hypothetical protein MiAbW_02475 [Microcystis aeruginosa NIES-4325]
MRISNAVLLIPNLEVQEEVPDLVNINGLTPYQVIDDFSGQDIGQPEDGVTPVPSVESDSGLIQGSEKLVSVAATFQNPIQFPLTINSLDDQSIRGGDDKQVQPDHSAQEVFDGGGITASPVLMAFDNQDDSSLMEAQEASVMRVDTAVAATIPVAVPFTPVLPPAAIPVTVPFTPVLPPVTQPITISPPRTITIGGQTVVVDQQLVSSAVNALFASVRFMEQDQLLNNPVVRFSNQNVPGTHFYSASADEVTNVVLNYPEFQLDGIAFLVGIQPGDNLLPVHRFANQNVPGTHFYTASEVERQNVVANYPEFRYDGIAYYVFDTTANLGTDVHRFSNQTVPGTHFYTASQAEYQNVLANYPQFRYDGIAYEVNIL